MSLAGAIPKTGTGRIVRFAEFPRESEVYFIHMDKNMGGYFGGTLHVGVSRG